MLGVALLVVIVGSKQLSASALHDFRTAWYCSAGFVALAAVTALALLSGPQRPEALTDEEEIEADESLVI